MVMSAPRRSRRRPGRGTWWTGRAIAAVLCAGCLPETGPGIGTRANDGRNYGWLASGPGPGERKPLLFTRVAGLRTTGVFGMGREPIQDLFVLRSGHSRPELLAANHAAGLGGPAASQRPQYDARGRMYLLHSMALFTSTQEPASYQLRRVDLAAGTTEELGPVRSFLISPGGTHLVLERGEDRETSVWVSRTLDDLERSLPKGDPQFAGEDVCMLYQGQLTCLLVEGGPQVSPTREAVLYIVPVPSAGGSPAVLVATGAVSQSGVAAEVNLHLHRLREPGAAQALASGSTLSRALVSPDGRWITFLERRREGAAGSLRRMRLLSLEGAGAFEMDLPPPPVALPGNAAADAFFPEPTFRPGRAEAWLVMPAGELAILRGDGTSAVLGVPPEGVRRPWGMRWLGEQQPDFSPQTGNEDWSSPFTADGRRFLYQGDDFLYLIDADAPAGPSLLQVPMREFYGVADILGTGQLATWTSTQSERVVLRMLDGTTLAERYAVANVRHVRISAARTLALVADQAADVQGVPADLVLAGGGGAPVTLATNVVDFALLPGCRDCDPLGAGATVAYVVRARVPWKHDGLWLADLP